VCGMDEKRNKIMEEESDAKCNIFGWRYINISKCYSYWKHKQQQQSMPQFIFDIFIAIVVTFSLSTYCFYYATMRE
jgi:hypothetical protein